jgi:hypothetical protein
VGGGLGAVTPLILPEDLRAENNGEKRRFDMRPYLHLPIYRCLENPAFFALARVDYGTVVWPGEIDIAPETLYELSVEHAT